MKKLLYRISLLVIVISIVMLLQKCGSDSGVNPSDTFIAGTITFTSPTPAISGGFYAVSFYNADSSNAFSRVPVRSDSLPVNSAGGTASVYYKSLSLPSGNYYIGCTFINSSTRQVEGVLGTFGCDTSHACASSGQDTKVEFPSYAGTATENFLSWNILSQRIH